MKSLQDDFVSAWIKFGSHSYLMFHRSSWWWDLLQYQSQATRKQQGKFERYQDIERFFWKSWHQKTRQLRIEGNQMGLDATKLKTQNNSCCKRCYASFATHGFFWKNVGDTGYALISTTQVTWCWDVCFRDAKNWPNSLAGGGAPERRSAKSQRALGRVGRSWRRDATQSPDTLKRRAEDLIIILRLDFFWTKPPCWSILFWA